MTPANTRTKPGFSAWAAEAPFESRPPHAFTAQSKPFMIRHPNPLKEKRILSWAPQAVTDSGQWVGNGLRFATKEEAEAYVAEFSLVRNTRVVESSDQVNYRWENGRVVRQD